MAKKRISVLPVDEIELELLDGTVITMSFDALSLMHFEDEEIGGLKALAMTKSQPELCAILLYVGTVERCKDMTLERARGIVTTMSIKSINDIIEEFYNSIGTFQSESMKELQKKTMMEFLIQMAK